MTQLARRTSDTSLQDAVSLDWSDIWANTRDKLRLELGQAIFDTWIAPIVIQNVEKGQMTLSAPSRLIRDYTATHYTSRFERILASYWPQFESVEFVTPAPKVPPVRISRGVLPLPPSAANALPKNVKASLELLVGHQPDPAQTFESFVVGSANEFAYKAALRFAQNAEIETSLLFIYGGFGFGKTHLLNAVMLEAKACGVTRPLFLRAEDFMRRHLAALRNQESDVFQAELRAVDLLVLDDLQHVSGRSTMREFLHTLHAFGDLRRKVVIAADRSPATLEGLTDDIRSQLTGALVIALEKPNAEMRLAILRAKAAELGKKWPRAAIPDSMLEQVAMELDASPRELLGVLMKLATYADLTGKPVTPEMAEEAIGSRIVGDVRKVTIEEIQKKTAEFFKLDLRELHSARRARRIARPRQVAMYLARELTARSLPDIGRRFGGRDHTTVLHACRRVESLCKGDPVFQQEVDFLRKVLGR